VPVGAGLSSSAAVECAVICALDEIAGTSLSREAVAGLALRAEREFVGVPCGPMDQLAAMLAQPDRAVLIDTRTTETALVPLRIAEAGLTLLVLDTRVRHSLASSEYANRRAACERAAAALGVSALVDASPDAVEGLPDPELRARARHVLSEHQRVLDVVRLLGQGRVADIGPALTASHRSLADDFEVSCSELDVVVESALSAGALGARMIGAGFGGSAIALCHAAGADRVARAVEESYQVERAADVAC
jgi:galactokinase